MKCNFVINGRTNDPTPWAKEALGFWQQSQGWEPGVSYILCGPLTKETKEQWLTMAPTAQVVFLESKTYQAEKALEGLLPFREEESLFVFGSDMMGTELSVRLAARWKGSSITRAQAIQPAPEGVLVEKMVFGNHMRGGFLLKKGPYCVSLAKGAFRGTLPQGQAQGEVISLEESSYQDISLEPVQPKEGLEEASFVVAVGRGAGSKAEVEHLSQLADQMGAEVGVSRPVAMNAWAPMEKIVGVSGAMLHPEVCIALGASGAAAFYAGVEKSKFLVAVNNDENARIFHLADVGIVGDCREVAEKLQQRMAADQEE